MGVHTIKCVGGGVRRLFIIGMAVIKCTLRRIRLKWLLLGINKPVEKTFQETRCRKAEWQDGCADSFQVLL